MASLFRHLVLALLAASTLASTLAAASPSPAYSDAAALQGVREGKGIFMISLDQPKKIALYLQVIGGTYDNFRRQSVAPDLKVVFIGASVRHLTRSPAQEASAEDRQAYADIARQVEALKAKGVTLEVCAIATALFGIDNASLLAPLQVINDGFISAIGYQTQGYQLVPIY